MEERVVAGEAGSRVGLGVSLVALILAGWMVTLAESPAATWLSVLAATLFLAIALPRAQTFPKILAGIVLAAIIACWLLDSDVPGAMAEGAGRGCFYGAFMAAVISLRDPVNATKAFGKAKLFISGRNAERSYPTLLFSAHMLALVLHMGSISVVASLSQRTDAAEPSKWAALATLHGFVATALWSPLSVAPAIVMAHMPAANHGMVTLGGLAIAALILVASIVNHRVGSLPVASSQPSDTGKLALRDLGQIGLLILGIFALLQAAIILLGVSPMASVVIVVPIVVIAMVVTQSSRNGSADAVTKLKFLVFNRLPNRSDEVLLMVLVGLLGVAISSLIENVPFAEFISEHRVGAALVLVGGFWGVVLAAMVGLNGLVSVVVLMEAIPSPEMLGVPPELVALVFILGWGVSAASSPLTPTTLLVAEAFGTSAGRVAFTWNGKFSLALLAAASAAIWLSAGWFAAAN